jgi:TRAP-type C4-dicarboxylate transport system substrate-binding protein
MARKAKAIKAASVVRSVGLGFHCPPHVFTDPAVVGVTSDVFATLDATTQKKVLAATHEGRAAVHKTLADANTNIASILKSGG